MVQLTLEFRADACLCSGGLELLVNGKKVHHVDVPTVAEEPQVKVGALLLWIRDHVLEERPEMFLKDTSVRPGVLVLVNDTDWELCDRLEGVLEDGDVVTFISTLHGG